jgi:DNA-binding response OmpR family regulator
MRCPSSDRRTQLSLVLVVDDEAGIRDLVRRYLEREGHQVFTAASGSEALEVAARVHPELVVLDLRLPDISGVEVARELRRRSDVPILMLTAKSDERDRIEGLEVGADDYVTKPFSPRELVLRVHAILRRHGGSEPTDGWVSYGGGALRIDEGCRQVEVDGKQVDLTPTEWGLLIALASQPGRVCSRYELINRVRGYEFDGYERTVDSHVKNLRHKLDAAGGFGRDIETVTGAGYRLGLNRDR